MIINQNGKAFRQTGDYRSPKAGDYYLTSTGLNQLKTPRRIERATGDWNPSDEPRIILAEVPHTYGISNITEAEIHWLSQQYHHAVPRELLRRAKEIV